MTVPAPRTAFVKRRRYRFDLRSTALFFVFLAVVVSVLGLAARVAAGAVERRPAWVFVLVLIGVAGCLGLRRRWRVAGVARRAAAALDEAAREAAEQLEAPAVSRRRSAVEVVTVDYDALTPEEFDHDAPTSEEFDHAALTPEEFEEAIAALCERDGCSGVEVVGGAGDLGADVLAVTPDGRRIVVQCKRYDESHRVGSQDLQRFGGTCFTVHEADVAVLVTTSDFTAPALEYAEQCGILCVDGETLEAWTDGTGPRPWDVAPEAGTAGAAGCEPAGAGF
ncbi:restriction system protein [Streptomyces sp. Ag82_O1-12]|uniref:restriction endonuclease n=1 Tax=unclassified Streptomyces TaxID=2593676 RepID=UPI000BCC95CC|nr:MULTISPECIES: restriction endonuclease [unclassified Streptomyces]SMQ21544.1 restriction system protein [Streptomyces sp. Ag82_O1-12]SOD50011.1 restriction system protein [Streptomyces sp. Ag82_G6-1]